MPKLSIYTYLFNARIREFDIARSIGSFLAFADEVVVATVPSQDDTYERLLEMQSGNPRLRVLMTNIKVEGNNRFDGDLKTAAMLACTHPIRIIADCDERFVASQRPIWNTLADQLLARADLDGYTLPVVDLYGDARHIRATVNIGLKFRMHKDTVTRRGVPSFAERQRGFLDTSASDTTEPLDKEGNLARFAVVYPNHYLAPSLCYMLNGNAYVIHEGFLDLKRRAKLGREFWKQHWEARSGHEERVAVTEGELSDVLLVTHGLPIE